MAVSPQPTDNEILAAGKKTISDSWRKWFNEIGASYIPYHKFRSSLYTTSMILTPADFGRIVKFDNGTKFVSCTLPSVGIQDIDTLIIIMRLGTGSLAIQCPDQDTIEKSRPGGRIVCNELGRVCANLWLYLATETRWAIIGGTGIWKAY